MIIFKKATTLTVISNKKTNQEITFEPFEDVDACISSDDGDYVDIKFRDGSVALKVQRKSVVVVIEQVSKP